MSNIIWTQENVLKEALKYKFRGEFSSLSKVAYEKAREFSILDRVCSHMQSKHIKYTKSIVLDIAKEYSSKTEFIKAERKAYRYAQRNGFVEDVFSNMRVVSTNHMFTDFRYKTGIYMLLAKDEIVYIGKSLSSVSHRLYTHYNNTDMLFDAITIHEINNTADINVLETYLIEKFKPIYNSDTKSECSCNINIDNWAVYVENSTDIPCPLGTYIKE